jgi:hypothetical protein
MKLFDFFQLRKLPKYEKNYLKVYANWGKQGHSDLEKQRIIQLFISLSKKLYNSSSLKFDIYGPGYGISKGTPYFGKKAFDNKLNKFGYKNFDGMTIKAEGEYISSQLIFINLDILSILEMCFLWENDSDLDLIKAIDLLTEISDFVDIEYAYAYPTIREMNVSEGIYEKGFFTFSSVIPKSEFFWSKNVKKIKEGMIKKIYPINCFNLSQLAQLANIQPDEKYILKNRSEIWVFKSNLVEINERATNCVLK